MEAEHERTIALAIDNTMETQTIGPDEHVLTVGRVCQDRRLYLLASSNSKGETGESMFFHFMMSLSHNCKTSSETRTTR